MTYRGRHRPAVSRRSVLAAGGIAATAVLGGGLVWRRVQDDREVRTGAQEHTSDPSSTIPRDDDLGVATEDPSTEAFARYRGLTLVLPDRDPVAVCYHEAVYPDAVELEPIGKCRRNANRTKFDPPASEPGPGYIVMSSRGRGTPATSAVDLVLRRRTPVLAPVTGRVVKLRRYRYEGTHDMRIEIVPPDAPELRVVVIHVDRVQIREGDELFAGETVLGVPRVFGFTSQIDYYIPGRNPHVHVEVKQRTADPGN